MSPDSPSLTALARAGFTELSTARSQLERLDELGDLPPQRALGLFAPTADPDAALGRLLTLLELEPLVVRRFLGDDEAASRLLRVLGASSGLAEFLQRHPDKLGMFASAMPLPTATAMQRRLAASVGEKNGIAATADESARVAMRVCYRTILTEIACHDLSQADPVVGVDAVARALAWLAGAALDASLAIARAAVSGDGPGCFPANEVASTPLAIIGMGKTGAEELNYLSDVDVIFVTEGHDDDDGVSGSRAVDIATRLAALTMRGIDSIAIEPPLWEVDANLRPEGKDGALVRTLESHLAYYDRWAKTWEFQALLKARAIAGDPALGARYVEAIAPYVWGSASRDNFVESVQRMRQRVTDNIPDDELHYQLKLGPGGLRDVEFTVQLLQLVHGQTDPAVRVAGTLPALAALAAQGYIGRQEAAEFSDDYRRLRLLEHRIQLTALRRTHLMPREEPELRVLARGTRLASSAAELTQRWNEIKHRVRGLHERLFYRPLLAAVASLPDGDRAVGERRGLTNAQAEARLAAIGFVDPRGALSHIAALTSGVSRRAAIQRHLLPVMLQWFADGGDPDYGLLAFRRLSEDLGSTHWFLRMLRDSSGAAERLTRVLSGSRFAGELLGRIPEAVAWLDDDDELRPRTLSALSEEIAAIVERHARVDVAASAIRSVRRREVLRLAFNGILHLDTVQELAAGLTAVTEATIVGLLNSIRLAEADGIEFAIIAMGRFGGRELGFGSDADVIYVYRDLSDAADAAGKTAARVASELKRLSDDPWLPLDLDLDLRPEGKNGPVVRTLESYRAYYRRWSLTWEAQALLRARGFAGERSLIDDFTDLADSMRYPGSMAEQEVREVKRIKARVENERLPQGAEPARHLKLGRGSLSDVEWLVQLEQLQHASSMPSLRTTSTIDALQACVDADLIETSDAELLREAWILASRARSALTLWINKTSDVLPLDRRQLEGVARLLGYPRGSATVLEEHYLSVTRRARAVFERNFYGDAE